MNQNSELSKQPVTGRGPWSEPPVLIVDPDPALLRTASGWLHSSGIEHVMTLEDGGQVLPLLSKQKVSALVLDMAAATFSGQELLEKISSIHPDLPVVIMGVGLQQEEKSRCGTVDYLEKPIDNSYFTSSVLRAVEIRKLREQIFALKEHLLKDDLKHPDAFSRIITKNRTMRSLFHYMEVTATSTKPVLISGEPGTGKRLFAKVLHDLSQCTGSFVTMDVSELDEGKFADALFGHAEEAFTGTELFRDGLLAEAIDGTLFLEGIGDLTDVSQIEFLRLLQEDRYYPVGTNQTRQNRARIVVATSHDLLELVNQKKFRQDLYHELRTFHMHIPSLRDRKADLPMLVRHFMGVAADSLEKKRPRPPLELFELLGAYGFPGNVRELKMMIHEAVARHHDEDALSLQRFKQAIKI